MLINPPVEYSDRPRWSGLGVARTLTMRIGTFAYWPFIVREFWDLDLGGVGDKVGVGGGGRACTEYVPDYTLSAPPSLQPPTPYTLVLRLPCSHMASTHPSHLAPCLHPSLLPCLPACLGMPGYC